MEAMRTRTEANGENAQHSTGPTSAAGKAVCKLNSLQHGLCSDEIVMPYEDPAQYAAFRDLLVREWSPVGVEERLLAETVAELHWKRKRAERLEVELFNKGFEPGANGEVSATPLLEAVTTQQKEFALMLRYSGKIARDLERARKALRVLQTERKERETAEGEELSALTETLQRLQADRRNRVAAAAGDGAGVDAAAVMRASAETKVQGVTLDREWSGAQGAAMAATLLLAGAVA